MYKEINNYFPCQLFSILNDLNILITHNPLLLTDISELFNSFYFVY